MKDSVVSAILICLISCVVVATGVGFFFGLKQDARCEKACAPDEVMSHGCSDTKAICITSDRIYVKLIK